MASDAESHIVPFSSYLTIWREAVTLPVWTMISRDATGKLEGNYPMVKAKHLVSANNTCRGMLKEPKVREAFITFAVRFGSGQPNAWYKQVQPPMTTAEVVDSFISIMLTQFSTEFIDYALKTPDNKGFHNRRRWDKVFEPALQPISLNAKMIDQMSEAFENTLDDPSSQYRHQLFRNLLFMTTHTLFHEVCHVFVSYLTKGEESTPPQMNDPTVGFDGNGGEAGRNIEYLVFGGTINWFHEPTSEDDEGKKGKEKERVKESIDEKSRNQCGTAYLKKINGGCYRIPRQTINETVSCTFNFPYRHSEDGEFGELRMLGAGFDPDNFTDPMESKDVMKLIRGS